MSERNSRLSPAIYACILAGDRHARVHGERERAMKIEIVRQPVDGLQGYAFDVMD